MPFIWGISGYGLSIQEGGGASAAWMGVVYPYRREWS